MAVPMTYELFTFLLATCFLFVLVHLIMYVLIFWDYTSGALLFFCFYFLPLGGWPVPLRRFIHWPWHDRDGLVG